ncbi:DUF262 domain-containing protein [Chryseobacterium cheonjiense]|uniref:DUF262 domain-containing protein n=1 Tax=Chryseobacterium cheonjiense TaxID=2728845 RepID=A0A7Y0FHL6_9FLAO|nr:DUF262 domain-containing protein [Chryseobacterium cheonjiense]NML56439.1 DUF262 domain-containing protein [Chryseobacterium cheonjiense]
MESTLFSLSKIFNERLFRIPDYQRGYAWTEKQLKDFWNDLEQLEDGKNHYTGVITLEPVEDVISSNWHDDTWIISSKSYYPYYIVDGQQRLTTSLILIQSIIEASSKKCQELNYTPISDIRKKFIFDSKDNGISRSYIFGYEKDNPSYEYLKTEIFLEHSETKSQKQETIYTQNLKNAKSFFLSQLDALSIKKIELLYRKLTQNLFFNIYTITSDIDTFVSFETMNNRGKPLSHLELLKNRLIYLSTKLSNEDYEKNSLRKKINECWKSIYHNLGRNKSKPLKDDIFLFNHYIIYFGSELFPKEEYVAKTLRIPSLNSPQRDEYANFLLEKKFTTKNLNDSKIDLISINNYVENLQNSVDIWYQLHNPQDSDYSSEVKNYLDKINRIGINAVSPLIMIFFKNEHSNRKRLQFLIEIERLIFIVSLHNIRFYYLDVDDLNFLKLSIEFHNRKFTSEELIRKIEDNANKFLNTREARDLMIKLFRDKGFYQWAGIRYFLYEYDLTLSENSKTKRVKLDWEIFDNFDYKSIEHIYPQSSRQLCWREKFKNFTSPQRKSLRNSLGNLLPISKEKNSSLKDKCFENKISNNLNAVGYRYGCYSENEITNYTEWTSKEILERGLKLIEFMEKRWKIRFSNENEKIKFLGLEFLRKK